MDRHCVTVNFSVRGSKENKKGLSPIEVSISYGGERVYFSTGKFTKPSAWSKPRQMVRGSTTEARLTNAYLIELRNKIHAKEIELMRRGYMVTATLLKDAVLDKVEELKAKTLLQVITEHNDEKRKLVGRRISPATLYGLDHSGKLVKEFIRRKYRRSDIALREVNLGFMQSFHAFLMADRGMSQNTSAKHLKFVKSIMARAVASGNIQCNMTASYKVEREPVEIDFLTEEELRRIISLNTSLPRLERARDFFLFGCFTGLAYIDIKTLEPKHLEQDAQGRTWIKKKRVKTGVLSRIPLLPMARMILEKYSGGKRLIPIQDASDINKNLKEIATLCHIDKHVTFHTSRHTFASTVTLANNISMEAVSKMLGHTNTRMTSHYAKLLDKCIAEQMDNIVDIYPTDK